MHNFCSVVFVSHTRREVQWLEKLDEHNVHEFFAVAWD